MNTVVETGHEITRDKIMAFERELKKLEQIDLPVEHHFAPGIYVRRMYIPAGFCLTGKIHKHQHLNICTGDISVVTEHGLKRFTGQQIILSSVGIKRVGFAHSDTTWVTIHENPTNETDIAKLENMYVTDSFEQLEHDVVTAIADEVQQ
jgi:hypothetical protein